MRVDVGGGSRFDPIAFGAAIKARRELLGLPQDRFAEQAGITREHLQLLESGLSSRSRRSPANPRLDTLIGLCRALRGRIDLAYPDGMTIIFDPLDER